MSFFVDVVSEDSFYENLTLGVMKLLEANSCIKNVQLERRSPCDRAALSAWEQKHCCLLTEDLRNFYTSTDGFLITWSLEIAGEDVRRHRMRTFYFTPA
jgi:tubulin polyglutamylase complex subunit 2